MLDTGMRLRLSLPAAAGAARLPSQSRRPACHERASRRSEEGEMVRLRAFAAACGAGLILSAAPVSAADYPAKPIRLIVPYSAGGANDLVGRAFGDVAGETLGQPLMVENRTGGAGLIGSGAVARADPDGYTL